MALACILGSRALAALLVLVIVYAYKFGQVVHYVVFIEVVLEFYQVFVDFIQDVTVIVA